MPRVMMRCPYDWRREFFTGEERSRGEGLSGLGNNVAACPVCNGHHYLRRLYFEGDEKPGADASARVANVSNLDAGYGFAGEIGVIVGHLTIAEMYLPPLLRKIVGMSQTQSEIIIGSFFSYSQKLNLLENLTAKVSDKVKRSDLTKIIKKLRRAGVIRDKYAHARYGLSVSHDKMYMEEYFSDAKKKGAAKALTIDDFCDDNEEVKSITNLVHGYLYGNERP